jgi:hypothetical protein
MSVVDDPAAVRCASYARTEALLPAGTAGTLAAVVAVELRLPWPGEVADHPDLVAAAPALAEAGVRVQALLAGPGDTGTRRVLACTRPPGPFAGYAVASWDVPVALLPEALTALASSIAADRPSDQRAAVAPLAAGPARRLAPGADAHRHVLVCTHGARDTCCGALGTRLAAALPDLGGHVRAWRTSHTGGHRFAPTALILPEGTAWAYLDPDSLAGILDRTLAPETAAAHYRGCTGLDGPEVQAADGAALAAVGWSWLDRARSAEVVSREGPVATVRLVGTSPAGTVTVEVEVATVRSMPVPDCGRPVEQARKSAPELVARRIDLA